MPPCGRIEVSYEGLSVKLLISRRQALLMMAWLVTTNVQGQVGNVPAVSLDLNVAELCRIVVKAASDAYQQGRPWGNQQRREAVSYLLRSLNAVAVNQKTLVALANTGAYQAELSAMAYRLDVGLLNTLRALSILDPGWEARSPEIARSARQILDHKQYYVTKLLSGDLASEAYKRQLVEEARMIERTIDEIKAIYQLQNLKL